MSSKYKIRNNEALHFVTFTVVNWIDVFTRNVYKDIVLDSFRYCQMNKGLEIYAYCIMTNHIHMIVAVQDNTFGLVDVVRDMKKYTASTLIKAIKSNPKESRKEWMLWMFGRAGKRQSGNKDYQFWRNGFHPIELSSNQMIEQRLDYIHENPVRAGFVLSQEEYLYSSAKNYAGLDSNFEVSLIC